MSGLKPLIYSLLAVSLSQAIPHVSAAQPTAEVSPVNWLLSQIQLGESRFRDDLVQDSLHRLFSIDPNNPDGLSAQLRLDLRQNNPSAAASTLARLKQIAPDSLAYKTAQINYNLTQPQQKAKLQQARLFARAGRYEQALTLYQDLFHGVFPTPILALEYWDTAAQSGQTEQAQHALQQLNALYPNNGAVQLAYARLLLDKTPDSAAAFALLGKLADNPIEHNNASQLWYNQLQRLPQQQSTADLWQRYLSLYPDASPEAKNGYTELAALLKNPAFQAKARAYSQLDNNSTNYGQIEQELQKALRGYPNDPQLIGELGRLRLRQGRHADAISLFERAQKLDTSADDASKWSALVSTARYWQQINLGDKALEQGQLNQAENAYRHALPIEPTDPYANIGLASVAAKRGETAKADQLYQQALRQQPDNSSALRGRVNLYLEKDPAKARRLLATLSPAQRKSFASDLNRIEATQLQKEAEQMIGQQKLLGAEGKYSQALRLQPDDVWLAYNLAKLRAQLGQQNAAETFSPLLAKKPADPELRYAYSLFLAGQGQEQQAIRSLRTLPETQWDTRMHELASRLEFGNIMDNARAMYNRGQNKTAIAYLLMQQKTYPDRAAIPLTLGDWAQQAAQWSAARGYYQQALKLEPNNADATLSLIEIDVAQGRKQAAQQALNSFTTEHLSSGATPAATVQNSEARVTPDMQRRAANLWTQLGNPQQARSLLTPLLTAETKDPLLFRDAGRVERLTGNPQQATRDFERALQLIDQPASQSVKPQVASTVRTPTESEDKTDSTAPNITEQQHLDATRQTRINPQDDWLKRSIRSDAENLYRQQDPTVTLEYDRWGSKGTAGTSDLSAGNLMLEAAMPYQDGRLFFRADQVNMNAGKADLLNVDNAADFGSALLCAPTDLHPEKRCQFGSSSQRAQGTALAVGWRGDRWQADIGTTPLGFEVTDWVGGISTKGDIGQLGWSAVLSRRPLSNSLLAYAGTVDPNTGEVWGGVRATGGKLGLSWDQGGPYGVWSSLQYHLLTGQNVEDNTRLRLMSGVYHRLIDEPHRRLRIGTNAIYWTFDKDLSNYTFGQGGYYSPQRYVSVSLPVSYSQRWEDWSLHMEASVGYSWPKSNGGAYYPTRPDLQQQAQNIENETSISPFYSSGGTPGIGYRARLLAEHRLTPHWFVGAAFDLEKSDTYTPSHGLLYLRYSFNGWNGDLLLPPEPLTPYADFD
ncbi:MAG: cellulose synthase complex outer membrane protein BcsC [Plesiomonas sp.]|uniref:cellulose synthase complex outer membrane protein BcsC n=1 Tax=Plesiomonas sp. TaxID=2486279 RepID=UPI003F399ADD